MATPQDDYERIGARFEADVYQLGREMFPGKASILDALAGALCATGRNVEALEVVDELLLIEPDKPSFLYNRACILCRLGRVNDALDALEMAVAGGFDDFEHMTHDPDLRPLRARPEFRVFRARALAHYTRRVAPAD